MRTENEQLNEAMEHSKRCDAVAKDGHSYHNTIGDDASVILAAEVRRLQEQSKADREAIDKWQCEAINNRAMLDFDGESWLGERWKGLAGNSYGRAVVAFVMLKDAESKLSSLRKERDEAESQVAALREAAREYLETLSIDAHEREDQGDRSIPSLRTCNAFAVLADLVAYVPASPSIQEPAKEPR